jgi:beta-lactamase superfamily II metal-dependent hydrolase
MHRRFLSSSVTSARPRAASRQAAVRLVLTAWLALVPLVPAPAPRAQSIAATVGDVLPPWSPGTLDIHQVVTGRGNAAFSQFPDGTTLLVDAGDAGETEFASQRPDVSRTPAQWLARYIAHMLRGRDQQIDYAVVTHFHPDHMGRITGTEPVSQFGDYRLRGLTELAEQLPIARLIDRGWPSYDYLTPAPSDQMFVNYRRFVAAQTGRGRLTMMRAEPGSAAQIVPLRDRAAHSSFSVRIVSANDRVWTGQGDAATVRFPALDRIAVADDRPNENMASVTLQVRYGAFSYFTGGDMPGYPVPGAPAWHDLETAIAAAIGPTDVHVVNHHGSIESANPVWLATLRSRVLIVPAWAATHPSPDVLKRLLSPRLYDGPRDVFVTVLREQTKATIGARAGQVASDHGHIVVRVEPGGARYRVYVLDDTTERFTIRSVHGPYESR